MSDILSPLYLPATLPYPITVSRIYVRPSSADPSASTVKRTDKLFVYEYTVTVADDGDSSSASKGKARDTRSVGTFESPIDGSIMHWHVNEGDEIHSTLSVASVLEPCRHTVQFGGLCGQCGKDLTNNDYLNHSDLTRASIPLVHERKDFTVSADQAFEVQTDRDRYLLEHRKLSLIVDLDLTVIQATVDPTVDDWMKDENNPNYTALQDVGTFFLTVYSENRKPEHVKYYIKPRPGLADFLSTLSTMFEMHVYTMGTRDYAAAVCKLIDPKGTLFGDRILSRSETEDIERKRLDRLFPVDTSMVAVIDDRSEVWEDRHNVVNVVPFDFFPVGDINGPANINPNHIHNNNNNIIKQNDTPQLEASNPQDITSTTDSVIPSSPLSASTSTADPQHATAISEQIRERPLLKLQREREEESEINNENASSSNSNNNGKCVDAGSDGSSSVNSTSTNYPILNKNDKELQRLEKILLDMHQEFFSEYESSEEKIQPDVTNILMKMKRNVLKGCHILFSSVIPLGVDPATVLIWQMAQEFGAVIEPNLNISVTHVVARKAGTDKVNAARSMTNVKIVSLDWLVSSTELWQWQKEDNYLLLFDSNSTSTTPPPTSSSGVIEQSITSDKMTDVDNNSDLEDNLDWDDMDKEVELALLESDDDSAIVNNNTVVNGGNNNNKRPRSNLTLSTLSSDDGDDLSDGGAGSPLLKRQKLARSRSGKSKLKVSFSDDPATTTSTTATSTSTSTSISQGEEDNEDENEQEHNSAAPADTHDTIRKENYADDQVDNDDEDDEEDWDAYLEDLEKGLTS